MHRIRKCVPGSTFSVANNVTFLQTSIFVRPAQSQIVIFKAEISFHKEKAAFQNFVKTQMLCDYSIFEKL